MTSSSHNKHIDFMKRALQIARNGLGSTRPNPMVGAVIVHDGQIIGEGYTSPYGGSHAEVNAVKAVSDEGLLKKSTLYVTLEPCNHRGKTPPCTDLIIKHQIPNVVIGCVDDNPLVSGKGITKLKTSGRNVIAGVLEPECKAHHKRFFTFHNKKRPFIILKWAESADGFIAPGSKSKKEPVWITNSYSRQLVHKWRTEEQAILVGTNTVLEDNPKLTARSWKGNNPIRVLLDQNKRINAKHNILDNSSKTLIIDKTTIDWSDSNNIAHQVCSFLFNNQINSVIIEGGSKTLQTFIDEDLWDEARIFRGPKSFSTGVKAPSFVGNLLNEFKIEEDQLKVYVKN